MWQTLAVVGLMSVAVVFVVRHVVAIGRSGKGCGCSACASCPCSGEKPHEAGQACSDESAISTRKDGGHQVAV